MAALASRGRLLANMNNTSKLLTAAVVNNKVPAKNINSKTSGMIEPRLKPWDYKKWGFNYYYSLIDGTTKRFTDNTKMIVVEGPPAIGKTEFAKSLAEELDCKFVPGFSMEDYYINSYGYDLRELDYKFHHTRNISYDEKKFSQDPTGQDGGLDRMLYISFVQRYEDYIKNLAHLFNTGEGIVTERSPHSDFIYYDAAYRQGWVDKTSRAHYHKMRSMTITELMRPNLIIHLDAPIDMVQSNIRARSATTHPWEKNSPVWENSDYMQHLYGDLMKQYLTAASEHSMVLSYDWSEGGDPEVVVEDIEGLNMDFHDKYDKQQKDWRLLTEDGFASKRNIYTERNDLMKAFLDPFYTADKLILSSDEGVEYDHIVRRMPGNEYTHGFNTILGDPEPFFNFGNKLREGIFKNRYFLDNPTLDDDQEHEDRVRANRKALGDKDWWKT